MRRVYKIKPVFINEQKIANLVIDPHVDKHVDHIDDSVVKKAVAKLNGGLFLPVSRNGDFEYFATDIFLEGFWYRLVWLLEKECLYVGVITLYRDRRIN